MNPQMIYPCADGYRQCDYEYGAIHTGLTNRPAMDLAECVRRVREQVLAGVSFGRVPAEIHEAYVASFPG